jgi:hypothetical protein
MYLFNHLAGRTHRSAPTDKQPRCRTAFGRTYTYAMAGLPLRINNRFLGADLCVRPFQTCVSALFTRITELKHVSEYSFSTHTLVIAG